MKWFFLILLVLFAFGVESLIVGDTPDQLPAYHVAAAVAFALFCLALFVYWWASYFLDDATQDRGSEFAHSMLTLSIGAYCIILGGDILISDVCIYTLNPGDEDMDLLVLLARVTKYLQENGSCAALAYTFLLLGGVFSWPTLKLLVGAIIKKTGYPSL